MIFSFCSYCFICVFAALINKVSLQVTVEGFIGGSVVLPCSSAQRDLKLLDINVHWRQKGGKIVYDVDGGKDLTTAQDQQYKNRAETFTKVYEEGNFSLKIRNLTQADAGKYICHITNIRSSECQTVQLVIKENEQEKPDDEGSTLDWLHIAVLLIVILIAWFLIFLCIKNYICCRNTE